MPPSAVVYQNCQAHGVPAGYVQPGKTILTTAGGNPQLEPEDAKSLTLGIVWTPGFAEGLTLTADYFDIRIDNAIQRIDGSTKLAICYNTPGLAHLFCGAENFTRNPVTGEVDFLSSQPVNAANEWVSGVDFGGVYEFDWAGFQSSLSFDATYLDRYDVRTYAGAETIAYAGKITGGRGSYTRWRGLAALTIARNAWSGSYSVQYIGKAADINASPGDIGDHAPSVTYHNVQVKYAPPQAAFDVALGIDNLFDRKAPYIQSYTDGNTDTMTYDLLGIRWYARFGYRW